MKSKLIITLTALLMLGGISAMARGSFSKGDINEDGVVNAADIVALANIIMNGEEPSGEAKYYWYAGPDMLTSETVPGSGTVYPMTTTADSQTGWHIIEGEPTSIETGDLANPEKINWVLAVPTALNLTHLSNGDDITDLYDITTVTCADGVEYIVFKQIRATKRIDVIFVKGSSEETKYYWYAGTTIPTAENISTIATGSEISKPDWSEPQSIKATNNTGESAYLYYCFPTEWNLRVLDLDKTTEMILAQEGTFTYGGISYTVQRTGRQISNGNSKDFYATTTGREWKYYWYAGTTLPTADNIASIALGSSNTIERWNGKEFLVTNTGSVATPVYVCTPVDFYVIWKDPNGFDINLPEVTDARFTYNGVEYKVQKKGRDLAAGAEFAVNGYYSDSETPKYYWYAGLTLPTADNIASIALGSSNTIEQWDGKEFSITNSGEESTPAYVCTPVDFKVSWKDMNGFTLNLVEVEGAGFTLNGVEYIVQRRGRDLIAGATITFRGYYDETITSNDYYIYIGLNRPTSSTDPETDLASNNTPLFEGYGAAGWRNIGSDISIYNASNPAYNGGANTVILDKEFNNVLCYVAIPVGMGIYDGLGNPIAWTLDQSNITIKSRQYNVYKNTVEGECTNLIYYSDSGEFTGVSQVPAQAVLIQSEGGLLTVQGLDDGTEVSVYGVNGTEAGAAVSRNGQAQVNTNLSAGSIAIVKIGDKSVKVVIK